MAKSLFGKKKAKGEQQQQDGCETSVLSVRYIFVLSLKWRCSACRVVWQTRLNSLLAFPQAITRVHAYMFKCSCGAAYVLWLQHENLVLAAEKIPCEEKEDKDISKLVSGIVKCSINRQISYKTVGPNEVSPISLARTWPMCPSKLSVLFFFFLETKQNYSYD